MPYTQYGPAHTQAIQDNSPISNPKDVSRSASCSLPRHCLLVFISNVVVGTGLLCYSESILSINKERLRAFRSASCSLPLACLHLECSCRHGLLCYSESVLSISKGLEHAFRLASCSRSLACLHLECGCRHGTATMS